MGRPKANNPRTITLHVRLTADEMARFQACADAHAKAKDANLSKFLRTLVDGYAAEHGVESAPVQEGPVEDAPARGHGPEGSLDPDKRDESAGGHYEAGAPVVHEHPRTVDIFDFARIRDGVREMYDGVLDASEFDELFVTAVDGAHAKVVARSSGSLTMNIPLADLERVGQ